MSPKLIKTKNKSNTYRFRETNTDEIKKFIEKLDPKRFFLKKKTLFTKYIRNDINALIRSSKFHNELKEAAIVPVHKKKSKFSKKNYRPISILRIFPKFTKDAYMTKCHISLKIFFKSINVAFAMVTTHNAACLL